MSYSTFLAVILGIPCAVFFYLLRLKLGVALAGWYAFILCLVLACGVFVIESFEADRQDTIGASQW